MKRYYLLLLLLFSFLSCNEYDDTDFLNIQPWQPHYEDHEPELQWRSDKPFYVFYDNFRIIDDMMIINGLKHDTPNDYFISAYDLENGDLLWSLDMSNALQQTFGRPLLNLHFMKEGQILYIVDLVLGRTFLVDSDNGELLETRMLNNGMVYSGFVAEINDHIMYHLVKNTQDQYTVIKYDIFSDELEEVMLLGDYTGHFDLSRGVFHEKDEVLYLHLNLNQRKVVLLAVDYNAKEVTELWSNSNNGDHYPYLSENLLLYENMLIFESGYETVHAIDRNTGKVEWVFEKEYGEDFENIFSHRGGLFLLLHGELMELDPQTGNIMWKNSYANLGQDIQLHPDEDLLMGILSNGLVNVYDLTNGQLLVQWAGAENEEGEKPHLNFISYDNRTGSVYLGTHKELMRYDRLLP